MPRTSSISRALALLTTLASLSFGLVVTAAPASAASDAYDFLARMNASRKAHGVPPLTMRSDLVSVAAGWTKHMASANSLDHNPNLASQIKNWKMIGENVGVGPTVKAIEDAFMQSAHHRENILDRAFTEVGVATVRDSKGQLWVTQDFRQPRSSTATKPVASNPAPKQTSSAKPTAVTAAPRAAVRRPVASPSTSAEALRARLAQLSRSGGLQAAGDPVSLAKRYVATMATLTH